MADLRNMVAQDTQRSGHRALLAEEVHTDAGAGDRLRQVEFTDVFHLDIHFSCHFLRICFAVIMRERHLIEVLQLAVPAELRGHAARKMDIRSAKLPGFYYQIFQRHIHNRSPLYISVFRFVSYLSINDSFPVVSDRRAGERGESNRPIYTRQISCRF